MRAALLSLGIGLALFVLVVLALAPPRVAGPTLALAGATVVPGIAVLVIAGSVRRRRLED